MKAGMKLLSSTQDVSSIKITCTSFDFLDNVLQVVDNKADNPIPIDKIRIILDNYEKNQKQKFRLDELAVIGLLNNEGSKLYMDHVKGITRERVFRKLANRKSDYYRHTGIWWFSKWTKESDDFKRGFFKGALLTEANINFSTKMYKICDVYTVLDAVAKTGAVVIALIVVVDAVPVVVANVEGIVYYCSTFGIKDGLKMYRYLGISGLPNGVLSLIKMDEQEIEEAASKTVGKSCEVTSLLNNMPELTGSNRDKLLSAVQNLDLRKIVNELYRPGARVGDGGTASKLVQEFYEGSSTHLIKAQERLNQLNNLTKSGKLGLNDLDILEALKTDLNNAINLFK